MDEPSDRILVLRVRRGEVDAYGEVVRRYQSSVYNVCYRLLGERRESEDLAQDTFLRAFRRLDTYDVDRPFGPWIRRVAANLCLNHLNRARPTPYAFDESRDLPANAPSTDPAAVLERRTRAESVRAAILQLPPHYRAAIEYRHFQDLSYAEIAETMGLTISQVKTYLYRARRTLADHLSDEHD